MKRIVSMVMSLVMLSAMMVAPAFAKNGPAPKATGGLQLSNPSQQISFNAHDVGASIEDKGQVEYQNFEYPGGLHYTADVLCAEVNEATNDARFLWQIPDGFPGLTGLYVVAYVRDGGSPGTNGDVYGHAATANLARATAWCETGLAGFSPTTYPITGGNLVVHTQ